MADELDLLEQLAAAETQIAPVAPAIETPQPSWLDQMSFYGIGQNPAYVGEPITPEQMQTGLARTWQQKLQDIRFLPEEAASIYGSLQGATYGAPLGIPGMILGGALGSYADVPVQKIIDYFTNVTPETSRTEQATKEALLGATIEGGVRLVPYGGKLASALARKGSQLYTDFMGPATKEAADILVGKELASLAPRESIVKAATEKQMLEAAGLPASELTTAQMTEIPKLAQAETLLKTQPLGEANVSFFNQAKSQLDEINEAARKQTDILDPNPKRSGEAIISLLTSARESARQKASARFTDEVREIAAPIQGISKEAKTTFDSIYQDTKVLKPSGELGDLYAKIKELEATPPAEKIAAGFNREIPKAPKKPTTSTVGMLQDLRSKALELSREAADGSREELFADRLVNLLGKRIDAVEGTEALLEARKSWRQFKQTWYRQEDGQRAPLAKLLRLQSPEDVISSVSKKSAVSDEYAKVLGALEPNKLANEMSQFADLPTVDDKLQWIKNKRAVYVDSPIWSSVQEWEKILKRIKSTGESGAIPGLATKNINFQAKALVRALGGAERQAVSSPAEAALLSAGANIARSSATTFMGGTAAGTVFGFGLGPYTKAIERRTDLAAKSLSEALRDPATALKYIDDASKYGYDEAAKIAEREAAYKMLQNKVSPIASQLGAFGRGAGLFTPSTSSTETMQPSTVTIPTTDALADLEALAELESLGTVNPTPEPTPAITTKVGKQNVSIPTGEAYTEPRLVKAVMRAESALNPSAVSPKGAAGLMQLMPATAKALGLKEQDRFDPEKNVEAGSRYLQKQLKRFGDEKLALAAYNWGPENIAKAKAKLEAEGEPITWENVQSITRVPTETKEYVNRVLLLRKYDDFDLAKIAAKVGEAKLDKVLAKYKNGGKFTVGDILDDLGIDAKDVRVKRNNVLQAASNLIKA